MTLKFPTIGMVKGTAIVSCRYILEEHISSCNNVSNVVILQINIYDTTVLVAIFSMHKSSHLLNLN